MAIEVEKHPCVFARCDGCEETLYGDDIGTVHFEGVPAAIDAVREAEWRVESEGGHTKLTCAACIENEEIERGADDAAD